MEGKCQDVATIAIKIYIIAEGMTRRGAWQEFVNYDAEKEILQHQRERLVALNDKKAVRPEDSSRLFKIIDDLEDNKLDSPPKHLADDALDMVIHVISDCECNREIDTLSDAEKARIKYDVMTPSRTGAIRG